MNRLASGCLLTVLASASLASEAVSQSVTEIWLKCDFVEADDERAQRIIYFVRGQEIFEWAGSRLRPACESDGNNGAGVCKVTPEEISYVRQPGKRQKLSDDLTINRLNGDFRLVFYLPDGSVFSKATGTCAATTDPRPKAQF